jgi:hypothetical protein
VLPAEVLDLFGWDGLGGDERDETQTIGDVGVITEIKTGLSNRSGFRRTHKTKALNPEAGEQTLENVLAASSTDGSMTCVVRVRDFRVISMPMSRLTCPTRQRFFHGIHVQSIRKGLSRRVETSPLRMVGESQPSRTKAETAGIGIRRRGAKEMTRCTAL